MCIIYRWRETFQDGSFVWRQNIVPCELSGPKPPCERHELRFMADRNVPGQSAPIPLITTIEPQKVVKIKPKDKSDDKKDQTKKKTEAPKSRPGFWDRTWPKPAPKTAKKSRSRSKEESPSSLRASQESPPPSPLPEHRDFIFAARESAFQSVQEPSSSRAPFYELRGPSLDSGIGVPRPSSQHERIVQVEPRSERDKAKAQRRVSFKLPDENTKRHGESRDQSISPPTPEVILRDPIRGTSGVSGNTSTAESAHRQPEAEIRRLNAAISQLQGDLQQARFLAAEDQRLRRLDEQIADLQRRLDDEHARQREYERAQSQAQARRRQTTRRPASTVIEYPYGLPPRRQPSDTAATPDPEDRPRTATGLRRPTSGTGGRIDTWDDGRGGRGPIVRSTVQSPRSPRPSSRSAAAPSRPSPPRRSTAAAAARDVADAIENEERRRASEDERRARQQRVRDDFDQEQEREQEQRRPRILVAATNQPRRRDSRSRRDPCERVIYDDQRRNTFNREI